MINGFISDLSGFGVLITYTKWREVHRKWTCFCHLRKCSPSKWSNL